MKPGRMHRRYQFVSRIAGGDTEREGPAGQRGSLFKGPDAAGRLPGFIPPGEGRRGGSGSASLRAGATRSVASDGGRCHVTLVARSTRYASTRVPRLARPATLARPRGGSITTS